MSESYHQKQVQRLIQETPKTIIGLSLMSCTLIYTFFDYVPLELILAWAFAQTTFLVLRYFNTKKLEKYLNSKDDKNLNKHINYLMLLMGVSATIWNSALIGFTLYTPQYFDLFSLIIAMGLITGSASSLSAIFKVYITYYFALLIPIILYIITFTGEVATPILVLSIILLIYTFQTAKSVKNSLRETIRDNIKLEKNEILLHKKSKDLEFAKDKAEQSEKIKSEY